MSQLSESSFKALTLAEEQIADLDLQLLKRQLRITETPCDTKALVSNRELKARSEEHTSELQSH